MSLCDLVLMGVWVQIDMAPHPHALQRGIRVWKGCLGVVTTSGFKNRDEDVGRVKFLSKVDHSPVPSFVRIVLTVPTYARYQKSL